MAKRRRKPGAGRKPKPDRKVLFTIRLLPHVLAELKAQAQTWQNGNGNVSAFTETLIHKSLQERAEEKRDPALKALLYMIGQLTERFSDTMFLKGNFRSRWRDDPFVFRAFKVAVHRLLDKLEEPLNDPAVGQIRMEETVAALKEFGAPPEWKKAYIEMCKSPEKFGNFAFSLFWMDATRTDPLPDGLRNIVRRYPQTERTIEREFYGLTQAVHDLELKPKTAKSGGDKQ
jgi:hypothetical protein